MKKLSSTLLISLLFITGCNSVKYDKVENNNYQWSISVDQTVLNFESLNDEWWDNIRKIIYENFDSLRISSNNINFFNGINQFNWNELLIEIDKNIFWIEFLNKLQGIKWDMLSIAVLSKDSGILEINEEEALLIKNINFANKEIILSNLNDIWEIQCSEEAKKILEGICSN